MVPQLLPWQDGFERFGKEARRPKLACPSGCMPGPGADLPRPHRTGEKRELREFGRQIERRGCGQIRLPGRSAGPGPHLASQLSSEEGNFKRVGRKLE